MLSCGDLTGLQLFCLLVISGRGGGMESCWKGQWFPKLADHENYLKNFEKTQMSRYPTTTESACLEARPRKVHVSNFPELILMTSHIWMQLFSRPWGGFKWFGLSNYWTHIRAIFWRVDVGPPRGDKINNSPVISVAWRKWRRNVHFLLVGILHDRLN